LVLKIKFSGVRELQKTIYDFEASGKNLKKIAESKES